MSRKRTALEAALDDWYASDPGRERLFEDIVSGRAGFSLRLIDWLVTNYAARKPVVYQHPDTGVVVDVNSMYKDVLRCFHKSGFDSFKRKGTNPTEASLRQRNFFRWAIENGVVDYARKNARAIERDMAKMRKKPKGQKKKRPISKSKGVTITAKDVVMSIPNFAGGVVW